MKNKKGFSLVELLIVIAVIGVLAGIVVPSVNRYLKKGKEKYNDNLNTELISFAKSYYAENKSKLPRGYLNNQGLPINKTIVSASYLLNNNYVTGEFKDSEGNDCTDSSYVVVEKEGDDYKYTPCIVCDNGYTSGDNKKCIYEPDSSGNTTDNILPRCTITLKSGVLNEWTNKDVVLNFKAEDNDILAGYSLNGGDLVKITPSTNKLENKEIEFNDTVRIDDYKITVEDNKANQGVCKLDGKIMIDKTPPTITGFTVTSNHKSGDTKNTTVKISSTDAHSGIDKVCITNKNNSSTCTWIDVASNTYTNDNYNVVATNSNSTTVTLYAFVKDKAGNVSDVKSNNYTLYEYCTEKEISEYGAWGSCNIDYEYRLFKSGYQYRTVYYVDKYNSSYSCGEQTESLYCYCDCSYRSSYTVSTGGWTCTNNHYHTYAYEHYCECLIDNSIVWYKKDDKATYANGTYINTYAFVCPTSNSYAVKP